MAEASSIPEEARNMIGKDFVEPMSFEIEKGAVRKLVEAIDDPNPLYRDEEYAKKSKHGGIITPALMLIALGMPELQVSLFGAPLGVGPNPMARYMNYEFFQPIRVGDVITITCMLDDLQEEQKKLGRMITMFTTRTFTNQNGELVGKEKLALSRY